MSPYSPEEKVARDYLLSQEADSILNVVDATNLERNLYLTTQLIETGIPVTVALNMSDVLEAQGRFIDTEKLSYQLGVPVIATSAIKQTGVEKAIKKASLTRKDTVTDLAFPAMMTDWKQLFHKFFRYWVIPSQRELLVFMPSSSLKGMLLSQKS